MRGNSYYSRTILSVPVSEIFNEALSGKKNYKREFFDFLRRVRCFFIGHRITNDVWRNKKNLNWLKEKDYEWHIGCRRCLKFYIRKP